LNLIFVFKGLSDDTAAFDRGEKFRHYRALPSLKAYLLISQNEAVVNTYLFIDQLASFFNRFDEVGVFQAWAVDQIYLSPK